MEQFPTLAIDKKGVQMRGPILSRRRVFGRLVLTAGAIASVLSGRVQKAEATPMPPPSPEQRALYNLLGEMAKSGHSLDTDERAADIIAKRPGQQLETLRRIYEDVRHPLREVAYKARIAYFMRTARERIAKMGYARMPWMHYDVELDGVKYDNPMAMAFVRAVAHRRPPSVSFPEWESGPRWLGWRDAALLYFAEQYSNIESNIAEARRERNDERLAEMEQRRAEMFVRWEKDLKVLSDKDCTYPPTY